MKKTTILLVAVVLIAGYLLLNTSPGSKNLSPNVANAQITVYREANCGCCGNYISYLKKQGISVNDIVSDDMDTIKMEHNVPEEMQSCHTSVVDGYVVEGHIPLEAIEKLLTEKPNIRGIAMPGMPSGSPGMPGTKLSPFTIHSLLENGDTEIFMNL